MLPERKIHLLCQGYLLHIWNSINEAVGVWILLPISELSFTCKVKAFIFSTVCFLNHQLSAWPYEEVLVNHCSLTGIDMFSA